MALSRLAFAAVRLDPRDRLVDAVIGLEALLLAGHDDHVELSFRFAVNFSMLEPERENRNDAYRRGRDLYTILNKLAQGSEPNDRVTVAGREMSLGEAADDGCDALRKVIALFLPMNRNPHYLRIEFWRDRYFGLS